MNYRRTKSGLNLSELGLGCMSLPTDKKEAFEILDTALDNGINYFDTADLYNKGDNEALLGQYFANRKREDYIIGSKVGNEFNYENNDVQWNPSREHIMHSIKQSLKRLNVDYLDLYMLHGGTIEDNKEETIEAFNILKKDGLIRSYGISSIRPNVIRYYLEHSDIDVIMMQFNMLDNRPEQLLDEIEKYHVNVLARGPVMKGLLTESYETVAADKFSEGLFDYSKDELLEVLSKIDKNQMTASNYRYLLDQPVASIIGGASKKEQLLQNIHHYYQALDRDDSSYRPLFKNLVYKDHL